MSLPFIDRNPTDTELERNPSHPKQLSGGRDASGTRFQRDRFCAYDLYSVQY
jgi:hypothetical protein